MLKPIPTKNIIDNKDSSIQFQSGIPLRAASALQLDNTINTGDPVAVARVRFGVPTDANGLVVGRWQADFFDCGDPWPNGIFSCCVPCISLGQIAARMGFYPYSLTCLLYSLMVIATYGCVVMAFLTHTVSETPETEAPILRNDQYYQTYVNIELNTSYLALTLVPIALGCLMVMHLRFRVRRVLSIPGSGAEDCLFTCLCQPCSIAQIAIQTNSYRTDGCCVCCPLATLPGYTLTDQTSSEQPQEVETEAEIMITPSVADASV